MPGWGSGNRLAGVHWLGWIGVNGAEGRNGDCSAKVGVDRTVSRGGIGSVCCYWTAVGCRGCDGREGDCVGVDGTVSVGGISWDCCDGTGRADLGG